MVRDGEKEKAGVKENGKMDCLEAANFQEGVSIKILCHGILVIKLIKVISLNAKNASRKYFQKCS